MALYLCRSVPTVHILTRKWFNHRRELIIIFSIFISSISCSEVKMRSSQRLQLLYMSGPRSPRNQWLLWRPWNPGQFILNEHSNQENRKLHFYFFLGVSPFSQHQFWVASSFLISLIGYKGKMEQPRHDVWMNSVGFNHVQLQTALTQQMYPQ